MRNAALWLPSYLLSTQGVQYTIVENNFEKSAGLTWRDWFQVHSDTRDMTWYFRQRMIMG